MNSPCTTLFSSFNCSTNSLAWWMRMASMTVWPFGSSANSNSLQKAGLANSMMPFWFVISTPSGMSANKSVMPGALVKLAAWPSASDR